MNILTESFSIFSKLRTAQKLVFLRVFIVINVSAFFLATRARFESDTANSVSMFVISALETCFMLWLGFKRGQRYHYEAGTGTSTLPTVRKVPMAKWYGSAAAVSFLASAITAVIMGNISDAPTTAEVIIFFAVEVAIMGLSLLQGLRVGWSAVTVSVDNSIPAPSAADTLSASSAAIGIMPNAPLSPEEEAKAKKRAQHIRRGQIALGCISVICAILAIYFHIVAHEMTQPDPENDAAVQAVSQALGDSTASSPSPQATSAAPAMAQAAVPEPGSAAALAGQGPAPAPQSPTTIPVTTTAPAPALTSETYGNQVATFFPGESATDAVMDGLQKINSGQSVMIVDYMGYPVYELECEKNDQCVNGTGTPWGSVTDNAKQMFPVNPADIQQYGLKCHVICYDSQGSIIGRDPNFHG